MDRGISFSSRYSLGRIQEERSTSERIRQGTTAKQTPVPNKRSDRFSVTIYGYQIRTRREMLIAAESHDAKFLSGSSMTH